MIGYGDFWYGNPSFSPSRLVAAVDLTYTSIIYTKHAKESKGSSANVHCIMEFRKFSREKSGENLVI